MVTMAEKLMNKSSAFYQWKESRTSKQPVPTSTGVPRTKLALGEFTESATPATHEFRRNVMVVSNVIFCKGEELYAMQLLLKASY